MTSGLPVELLVQLFLVFEGYSLWKLMKLPEETKLTTTDYDEACKQILHNSNSPDTQRVDQIIQYKEALKKFNRAKAVLGFLEKPYIPMVALSTFLITSIYADVNSLPWRKGLTATLTLYFLVKILIYRWGKGAFSNYQAEQDKLNAVSVPDDSAKDSWTTTPPRSNGGC